MNRITKEHILHAIQEIDKEGIRNGRHSSTYDVVYNGKKYPPKLIISIANRFATGKELDSKEFHGGKDQPAFKLLENFGFLIEPKRDNFTELIEKYKAHIKETKLKDELYKWDLLDTFKGRPDLNAENFLEEVKSVNYSNLLFKHAKAVIYHLASKKPNELKGLFKSLFDENISINNRVKSFNERTLELYRSIGENLQHHQDERTIGAYLTFYNPDKYTFYKFSFYKKICELLSIRLASKNEKFGHYLDLVNAFIRDYIEEDQELIDLVKSYVPLYDGTNHLLLAQDILYQMLDKSESINYWLYSPGENASKWDEFYEEGIMGLGWDDLGDLDNYKTKKDIQIRLQEIEKVENTKQNDTAANYEFHKVIKEGDIIIVKKGVGELLGYGEVVSDYFYDTSRESFQKCRSVDWKLKGNWKVDFKLPVKTLTDVTKYPTEDSNYTKYYEKLMAIMENPINSKSNEKDVFNFNIPLNQILYGPPGTGKTYNSINKAIEIINPNFDLTQDRETVKKEFDRLVTEGQIVFTTFHQSMSYEDFIEGIKPIIDDGDEENKQVLYEVVDGLFKQIVGRAKEQKKETIETSISNNFDETWERLIELVKLKISNNELLKIGSWEYGLSNKDSLKYSSLNSPSKYTFTITKQNILDVYQNKKARPSGAFQKDMQDIVDFMKNKFQLVDYKENNSEEIVVNNNDKYVLIIDEINRGNVSQIFGELITLIEESKRLGKEEELEIILPYSKKKFGVPSNIYIVGTMNTADRSVEALDTALRRRFSFVEMMPNEKIVDSLNFSDTYDRKGIMQKINQRIEVLLDRNYTLGHSYFIKEDFKNSFENEIIPLLQEYFYNDYGKIGLVLGKGFVREKAITAKNDKSIFADFDTKNEVDINKSYELIPFTEINFDEAIQILLV